jgi:phosphate transport system permease protein
MMDQEVARTSRSTHFSNSAAYVIFLVCAILLIVIIIGVFVFIGINGLRLFGEGATVKEFFTSTNWDPSGATDINGNPHYGAAGLILGSIITTVFSVIIATPLAFGMALFFTELCPRWLAQILQPLIEIFTGMPSIVLGFLGLVVLVPFLTRVISPAEGGRQTAGYGWGAAILVLVVMILPTIISISIDSIRAVPGSVREASLALGSTRWQTMSRAIIPAATTGLATGVVLGLARAVGETLAVAVVLAGANIPTNLFTPLVFFQPNVNITQQIAFNFAESLGAARDAYFTLALVLLVISFLCVSFSRYLASRSVYR